MHERAPRRETIGRGEILFLSHPGTQETFSGYGLTAQPGTEELLVGLLMIDRPHPADPEWIAEVEDAFGECELVAMTPAGERGIACQMQIEPDSLHHLRRFSGEKVAAIRTALQPLLVNPPKPAFTLRWDKESQRWRSEFAAMDELPEEIRKVLEEFGYGCLVAETNIGVVHVCHAADGDIEGFANKPVSYQWQLLKMPTAPLIRLELAILDCLNDAYRFESFLNVADDDQARVLAQLAGQDRLYLAFYGDDLSHRFTKIVNHDRQQWQYLDELSAEALGHWDQILPEQRDFDRAKAEFMRHSV